MGGFRDWTASIETVWNGRDDMLDDLGSDNSGAYSDLELEMIDAGASIHGSAICTGVTAKTDKEDVVRFTYTFQGSGTLAYSA